MLKKNHHPMLTTEFKFGPNFWLKIEPWVVPFEEISMFSHGGHLGYRTATMTDTEISSKGTTQGSISSQKVPKWLRCISIMMSFLEDILRDFL